MRVDRARRSALRVLMAAATLALAAGCASISPPLAMEGQTWSGRLALRVEGDASRNVNAGFELRGGPMAGELDLSTPLGSVMARARWAPGEATLEVPTRPTARHPDLDTLTQQLLGEPFPVSALFDWLQGRPWPGASHTSLEGQRRFEQLGWKVDASGVDDGNLLATRDTAPPVTVRVRLDR